MTTSRATAAAKDRPRLKSSSDVLAAINELEHRHPVQHWRAGDIDLWPPYRIRLYMNVTLAMLSQDPPPGPLLRRARLAQRLLRAAWRPRAHGWRDRRMQADANRPAQAVCLSDGTSFALLDGCWHDRVMDPLVSALAQRGRRALKLTPGSESHVPRALPSLFVQPTIDSLMVQGGRHAVPVHLPGFDAFATDAAARFTCPGHVPTRAWLVQSAGRIDLIANAFARMIDRAGATQAFVNTYYAIEGFAFVQGARRSGARSADLQHGLQGPHHGAYGAWAAVPPQGYSTLPDEFWVWSNDEAQAIDAWRTGCSCHAPRIIGNLWQQRWLGGGDPIVERYVALAREARRVDVPQALVSLSWGLADEETDKIIRAAKRCGDRVGWWWRLHPLQAHLWRDFARRLVQAGLDASGVQQATELPLHALLRAADVTLAHSSTVVQEAALFGVPSVVTSDYGAELHAKLLAGGQALLATSDAAIADAVQRLLQHGPVAPSTAAADDGLERALDAWEATPARAVPPPRPTMAAGAGKHG